MRERRSGFRLLVLIAGVMGCLGCKGETEEPQPVERLPVQLIVQASPGVDRSRLETALATEVGPGLEIEPLFEAVDPENDPEELGSFYLVAAPRGRKTGETEWDAAYRVRDLEEVRQAEPDAEATLETPTAAGRATCLAGDDERPEDTAWSLRSIRAPEAWALEPGAGGKRFGEDVRICHPDTGWTDHPDLDSDRLDRQSALDLLTPGGDARDLLESGLMLNPGHGTGTGSVIASGGAVDSDGAAPPGRVTGVVPAARLVPIRTAKSVVQVFDSDLARAVRHAVVADCDVVSMSLGGRLFFGLRAAIRDAVRNDVIVAAAAGNCVRMVVAPAAYEECLAVGGVNIHDAPWRGSSRGRAVTVSGPAQHVWAADRSEPSDPPDAIAAGQGTSYAVANVAGVAALWLAFHGEERLEPYRDAMDLQDLFVDLMEQTVRVPDGWDDRKYGAGVVDARALLEAPLPELDPATLRASLVERSAPLTVLETLERVFDVDRETLISGLSEVLEVPEGEVPDRVERLGPEFVEIVMRNPERFYGLFEGEETDAASRRRAVSWIAESASERLRSAL